MQNIFLNSSDPLLNSTSDYFGNNRNLEEEIARLDRAQQALEQRKNEMAHARQTMAQPQQSQSPVWDEIEKLTAELSDREFDMINNNEDFQASQQTILAILQREQMRLMRPIVERTQDGKEALDNHLALIKQLRKKATKEADKNMELFNEYTQHYSDMTFSDFMKMKNGTGKTKNEKK